MPNITECAGLSVLSDYEQQKKKGMIIGQQDRSPRAGWDSRMTSPNSNRPITPELRSIPLTYLDCEYRTGLWIIGDDGELTGDRLCEHPKWDGFPCEASCKNGEYCPRGYRI